MTEPIRITHIITDLEVGGAEIMLYRLLTHMNPDQFCSEVISLSGEGAIGQKLVQQGIPVHYLNLSKPLLFPAKIFALVRKFHKDRPDMIQTWMYHADLVGCLSAWLSGNIPTVWGIHNSTLDPKQSKRRTLMIMQILAKLSHWLPEKIISCSETAAKIHIGKGYDARKMVTIPNGFDTDRFRPDPTLRQKIRAELCLEDHTPLVGLIARFDPQKDHLTFLKAAEQVKENIPGVHFLLCGDQIEPNNMLLMEWIHLGGLADQVHLLGKREDIPALMASLDLLVVSSAYGEAFPLVCGEAMACGIPCIVTDLGDSALLVGETGKIVKPRSPEAIARAIIEMLSLPIDETERLGQMARRRIQEHYSINAIARRYESLYMDMKLNIAHKTCTPDEN